MALHDFEPKLYHSTLGSHAAVLQVKPGDTVHTTTVDAGGWDKNGDQCGVIGNPQTGPFFVVGAEPGDTLVVKLDKIWPNRATGFSGTAVVPGALDFGYRPEFEEEHPRAYWDIDLQRGIARLATPSNRLNRVELPLRPMLGCFGVAPDRGQAISTSTSGPYGGNMDYRGFVAGVTVYFPVFAQGALFHLGDGHAVQGDGELLGSGIETAMEVTFTLDLQKGKKINWPRAEDGEHIMAIGCARPLDQAVQHATTEMVRWLQEDYGLTAREAHLLLGQCGEYQVGNVCDPAYSMACKIAKALLAKLV